MPKVLIANIKGPKGDGEEELIIDPDDEGFFVVDGELLINDPDDPGTYKAGYPTAPGTPSTSTPVDISGITADVQTLKTEVEDLPDVILVFENKLI